MAIQVDPQQSLSRIVFTGSYYRIVNTLTNRTGNEAARFMIMIEIFGYVGKPESEDVEAVDSRRYFVQLSDVENMSGNTFLAKCYTWLMAQSDMTGSVAV